MLVYLSEKSDFIKRVEEDTIANDIYQRVEEKLGRKTPKSEFRSWENSLLHMYKVLNDDKIPDDSGIAIEYNIPQTSKRVDFIISGYDKKKKANIVIVELKQWDEVKKVDGQDGIVETYLGGGLRKTVHPSYQAWTYARLIKDYNSMVQDKDVNLAPCAYLHNYIRTTQNDPLDDEIYNAYYHEAPAYTKGQVTKLREFIKEHIVTGDNQEILYTVDQGKIRPSKRLQDEISNMLKGNQSFNMIDEQKVAYEQIKEASIECMKDDKKRTIIVEGGPGTGKSVIAINLLADLTKSGQLVQYSSKNAAPRDVYKKMLKGDMKASSIDNMFKSSGSYCGITDNGVIHTILVDEAHRLNEKSGMFNNMGENQIKEVIHAAKCSVFFIDESQRVTLKDIGSVEEIEKWANEEESEITKLKLISQFRCNGSNGYLAWLDDILEIRDTANYNLEDIEYDFDVCDTPQEVYDYVLEHNHDEVVGRMLAGYCWKWGSKTRNDSDVHDIKIGDFGISWNLNSTTPYALDPGSVEQAGCIHTCQGLEFDYVGVIIGNDMTYDGEHIVTDFNERASTDRSLFGIKKLYKENPDYALKKADEVIKNTYRTLMTRGMKGCRIYCTDKKLAEYIKSRL